MNSLIIKPAISAILLLSIVTAIADPKIVNDPVSDYIQRHSTDLRTQEQRNEHVLKFQTDLDNDGKLDVFLSSEKSSLLREEYDNDVRTWDFYKDVGGGNYAIIGQEKSTDGTQTYFTFSRFEFDPEKVYIGTISEMGGGYGMLAMYYIPRKSGAYISAYILGNGYFETKNFPDPAAPEAGMYHRDNSGKIPDFPAVYKHYFALPPTQKIIILPQTF